MTSVIRAGVGIRAEIRAGILGTAIEVQGSGGLGLKTKCRVMGLGATLGVGLLGLIPAVCG